MVLTCKNKECENYLANGSTTYGGCPVCGKELEEMTEKDFKYVQSIKEHKPIKVKGYTNSF